MGAGASKPGKSGGDFNSTSALLAADVEIEQDQKVNTTIFSFHSRTSLDFDSLLLKCILL